MNWGVAGVSITGVLAIVAFNAWCMKLVIDNAIGKNMLLIMDKFLTKEEFEKHVKYCFVKRRLNKEREEDNG